MKRFVIFFNYFFLIGSLISCGGVGSPNSSDTIDRFIFERRHQPNQSAFIDSFFISTKDSKREFIKKYYSGGKIVSTYYSYNGHMHGLCLFYNDSGRVIVEQEFYHGKMVKEIKK